MIKYSINTEIIIILKNNTKKNYIKYKVCMNFQLFARKLNDIFCQFKKIWIQKYIMNHLYISFFFKQQFNYTGMMTIFENKKKVTGFKWIWKVHEKKKSYKIEFLLRILKYSTDIIIYHCYFRNKFMFEFNISKKSI